MRSVAVIFAVLLAAAAAKECPAAKANSKLFCYFSKLTDVDGCRCSFVILPADADVKAVEGVRGAYKGVKVLVTVNEFNQGLIDILKSSKVDGLEIDLKKLDSKSDIVDFISTVRSKLGDDLYLALSVPGKAETLAKYYDFKGLSKHADVFILQTAFLGASKNVTFHPSRLSGLWDTQNTDSMVDLVSGMGAPLSKVVITAPVQAFHFTLQDGDYSAPGSPALELKSITRKELCNEMKKDVNWTLERDQDQAGPYIFSGKNWIAFEDSSSIDVKAKYARVRGLAGLALKDVSQDDGGEECGSSVLEAASEGLSRQARAPRAAVLHSLERELQGSAHGALAGVRVSPYRISRVIDVEGHIHVVRQDTRTEFTCSRQGFFAHPRSCNRFYRCVLFDQTSDEFSVFEFDCPAGLAFDERVEVCVWPGSLPEGRPCSGSSEIAPVPRSRFVCPQEPGYYADPENCRWFFACLDHGDSPLSAYEFRCPFGLVFDSDRLVCEWPWLVSRCASSESSPYHLGQEYLLGGSGNALDQYNGLGSLGVIKLGGLSGQYRQPVVYSNVGGGAYPTAGFGGIGSKATQALVNAGLLRTGSFGHNSNLGLGSSSLNQHVGIGTSQQGSAAGSYSYTSSSGSGASSSIRESSTQANAFHNSASGGYISDTILALGDTSSFGAKSAQDLLQNSLGLAAAGSSQYPGSSKEGFESYPHGSILEGTQNERTVQLGSTQYQSSGNGLYGNYLSNSNSGSDSSNSNSKTTLSQLHYTNDGSYNGITQSGTAQFDGSTSAGTSDRFVNFGASQYQNPNDGGSTSYITNAGIDSSSSYGSHQDGNKRVVSFGSSQYQSSRDGAAALEASSLFGAKTVLDENNNGIVEQSQLQGATYGGSGALGTSTSHFSLSSGNLGGSEAYSYSYSGQNEVKSSQEGYEGDLGTTHTQEQNHRDSSLNNQVDNKAFGFTQQHFGLNSLDNLHQVQDSTQYQPSAGSINIVGGGYSAVKQSNVQITHNGEDNFGFVHTTAAPASVSTYSSVPTITSSPIAVSTYASVPTVTAVPVPTLGTPTAFGHYNGGVIANIPQLQYRYESSNASSGFVSSTPYSISSGNGYQAASGASSYNYQSEVQGLSSNIQTEVDTSRSGGYVYNKPSVPFEEVPVPSTTVRPVELHSGFQGYRYEKPSVSFEENPLPKITTPVPVIAVRPQQVTVSSTLAPVQPIIHTYRQEVQTGGYHYPKPSVTFIERPSQPTVISRFSIKKPEYQNTYVGPAVGPAVFTLQQPIQKTSYSFKDVVQPVSTYLPVTEKPVVLPQAVVSSYYYKKPAVSSYTFQDIVSQSTPRAVQQVYSYSTTSRPAVSYLPATEQPVVVSTYDYVTPTTAKPVVYTYTSPKPAPYVPQIVSTTSAPQLLVEKQNRVEFGGYEYPKPRVTFVEQPVEEVPFVKKTAYVTGNPVVVENYQSANYEKVKSKLFAASAGASSKSFYNSYETVSSTPAPIQRVYVQSTPRPTYYSTVASVLASKAQYDEKESNFHYYDSRFSSNAAAATEGYSYPKPTVSFEEEPAVPTREYLPSTTSRPILRYSFSSLDDAHQVNVVSTATPVATYEVPSSTLTREYLPARSTVRVTTPEPIYEVPSSTLAREYLPVRSRIRVTTPEPIYEVPSSTLVREYLPARSTVRVTTPEPTYEVPSSTLAREYLPARSTVRVTTPEPIYEVPSSTLAREYLPVRSRLRVTTPEPIYEVPSSTLAREYLPVRSRVRVTTPEPIYEVPSSTLAREYLPARSRVRVTTPEPIYEVPARSRLRVTTEGNVEVSSRRPVKVVKVIRPRTKTIIKENDMHPILSAKLGAQCTCVSNTINLRKKQKIIVVEDDDEDDGYVVSSEDQSGTIVENYEYDSHSTPDDLAVPPRRERVRPEEASAVSDKEIAQAVRTGLQLVKQAAKEGAEEAISNYSPRTGSAREGIECQRAGLFRHPSRCDKFYSCKWDCKKNKYTLHVFDCPVHLTFDNNLGACNWPSQGPACTDDTLLPNE